MTDKFGKIFCERPIHYIESFANDWFGQKMISFTEYFFEQMIHPNESFLNDLFTQMNRLRTTDSIEPIAYEELIHDTNILRKSDSLRRTFCER